MRSRNRPVELVWLEDFLTLSGSGSFSRAAELRSIAQPAFSRHIRSLEEWVGATLFDRSTHPASLTEAGRQFRPAAEDILRRLALARETAREAHDAAATTLRFAATHVLSLTFFPGWLRGLESRLQLGRISSFPTVSRRARRSCCRGAHSFSCAMATPRSRTGSGRPGSGSPASTRTRYCR
jgi:DNA-binding transcriptional LysR family regulator